MARQALAVQPQPMTLGALTAQVQTAVEPQGWTALVVREGDSLVVDLFGAVCPDPLLAMMTVEAVLGEFDTAGLEAVKLYGYCAVAEGSSQQAPLADASPGWMSVIDLAQYFARRSTLAPEAFGLGAAEAARMACAAERDRYFAAPQAVTASSEVASSDVATELVSELVPDSATAEPGLEEHDLELEHDLEPEPRPSSLEAIQPEAAAFASEDPWEVELPSDQAAASHFPLNHFPRVSASRSDSVDLAEPREEKPGSTGRRLPRLSDTRETDHPDEKAKAGEKVQTGESDASERFIAPQKQSFPQRAVDLNLAVDRDLAAEPSQKITTTQTLAALTGYDLYRAFITEKSSWFAQTVRDNPGLHKLAKQRQHYTIGTLSHYLADTLTDNERLMDLVPVRKRDRGCGLIFTDQRIISLSQPSRRDRQGLQVWMVPWSWVHKVEIGPDALQFHYGRAKERFSVDLEAPYHLRNAIPRDIPVRMVRELRSSQPKALDTKVGLAMVAGVMFAIGSGFSFLNNVANRQQVEARSNPLAISRSALGAADSSGEVQMPPAPTAGAGSMAVPLEMTTNHEQCIDSFNNAAQPHAYATLNQVTQTLQVNFQNQMLLQMSQQQFDQTATAVAEEILSSCQAKAIGQVVVTNGSLRYQQQRSPANVTSVKAEEALKLF